MAREQQQAGRWRACVVNLGLLLASLLLTAGLLEIGLRIFTDGPPPAVSSLRTFTEYDPELGWRGVPEAEGAYRTRDFKIHVRLNAGGWRDDETEPALERAGRRILLLGDSYAWGFGVEQDEMFASRLEQMSPGWTVLNLGVPGYGPDQELLLLEQQRAALRPDLVLVQFSLLNDLGSIISSEAYHLPKPFYRLRDGALELNGVPVPRIDRWDTTSESVALQQGLSRHSYLFSEVRRRWRPLRLWLKGGGTAARPQESRTALFLERPPAEIDAGWAMAGALLAALRDEAARGGAGIAVLAVCDPAVVEDRLWQQVLDQAGPDEVHDRDLPSRRLAGIAGRLGIPVIDPTPWLREETGAGVPLFVSDSDPHWNAHAHDLVARLLAERLATDPDPQARKKLSTSSMSSTGEKAGSERAKATP